MNGEATLQRIINNVERFGWHIVLVPPTRSEPAFGYSIGFFRNFGHPEIVLFGTESDTMVRVLNFVGEAMEEGVSFNSERERDDLIDDTRTVFRAVRPHHLARYMPLAALYYGDVRISARQLIWADSAGKFPWERGCLRSVVSGQPLLFES